MSTVKIIYLLQGSIRINIIIQVIKRYIKNAAGLFLITTLIITLSIITIQKGFVFRNKDFLDLTKVLFNTIKTIFGIWGQLDFDIEFSVLFTSFYLFALFILKILCVYFFVTLCNEAFDEVLQELKEFKKRKLHDFLGDLFREYLFYLFFPLCLPNIIYKFVKLRRTFEGMDNENCLENIDHKCKIFIYLIFFKFIILYLLFIIYSIINKISFICFQTAFN
jgi:hypothetical protein